MARVRISSNEAFRFDSRGTEQHGGCPAISSGLPSSPASDVGVQSATAVLLRIKRHRHCRSGPETAAAGTCAPSRASSPVPWPFAADPSLLPKVAESPPRPEGSAQLSPEPSAPEMAPRRCPCRPAWLAQRGGPVVVSRRTGCRCRLTRRADPCSRRRLGGGGAERKPRPGGCYVDLRHWKAS